MKKTLRFLLVLAVAAAMMLGLSACVAEPEPTTDPNLEVLELTLQLEDAAAISQLEQYPNLQKVDLTGSDCYAAIADYIATHPQVAVTYDVAIGNGRYHANHIAITLEVGSYTFAQLQENLQYLPLLTELTLPNTNLTNQELTALKETYPHITLNFSVDFLGTELDSTVTELDLTGIGSNQLDAVRAVVPMLGSLTDIYAGSDASGNLTPADIKLLMEAAPGVTVHYTFDLFDQTISTTAERVEFVRTKIGNDGIDKIREALDILPNCTYFKMDRCGVDDEIMAQLREDYPNTKIVWRVFFAFYNCLTDVEMLHCTNELNDVNVQVLKYCNDVLYLDIGHNTDLADLSFVSYMPKLKIAIVVDCATPDVEAFGNCPDLEWLEITNCYNIKDISPLANCTKLKGLNMSGAFGIKDLSPLHNLQNMERLYLGRNTLPDGQYETAKEKLPNCWVTNTHTSASGVSLNYAIGWRLDPDGSRAEWYKEIRKIFRYDENYYNHDD